MAAESVTVVPTGVANLASILAGLRRAGARPDVAGGVEAISSASRLVLPGVGSFEAAMTELRKRRLDKPLRDRMREGRPTLAICLGLQLLGSGSEESPGTPGLGVFDGRATRFDSDVRVPQLGWNWVEPEPAAQWFEAGYAYFANSYRLHTCPPGWQAVWSEHGGRFVAGIQRGAVLACQFHPELSGRWGIALLGRWLQASCLEVQSC
jgi:imidazole glycerol phosphate synthase glutamine amidotransferase subunit